MVKRRVAANCCEIRNHSRRACSHGGVPGLQLAEEQRHTNCSTKHCSAATSRSRSPESRADFNLGNVLGTLQRKHSSRADQHGAKAAAALFITPLLPDSMEQLRLGLLLCVALVAAACTRACSAACTVSKGHFLLHGTMQRHNPLSHYWTLTHLVENEEQVW